MSSEKNNPVKKISILGIAALFMINFAYMSDFVIIPAADAIYEEFSGTNISLLDFILTGPQLIGMFSALLLGVLMRRYSKKSLIVLFFTLFTVASCLGAVIKNPVYMAIMRALAGFSYGGLAPAGIALILEVYQEDEKRASNLVSAFNGTTALFGVVLSIFAGLLCSFAWDYVFYIFWAGVPILLLMIVFLPKTSPPKVPAAGHPIRRIGFMSPILPLLGSAIALGTIFNILSYQCSFYVMQNDLGGPAFVGILASVLLISTGVGCFIFPPVYARLKRGTSAVFYFVTALGFLMSCFPRGQAWGIVSFAIPGFTYGLAMSYFYLRGSVIVPPEDVSMVTGIIASALGLSAFLSAFFNTLVTTVFRFENLVSVFPLYAAILTAGGIMAIFLTIRKKQPSGMKRSA
jgi:MFS family permease